MSSTVTGAGSLPVGGSGIVSDSGLFDSRGLPLVEIGLALGGLFLLTEFDMRHPTSGSLSLLPPVSN